MTEAQRENLAKGHRFSKADARECGAKGAKASALKRNANKYISELAIKVLTESKTNTNGERYYERQGMSSKKSEDMLEAIIKGITVKAMKGDATAVKQLMELIGCSLVSKKSEDETTEDNGGGVVMLPEVKGDK